jgi:hypothetical protein
MIAYYKGDGVWKALNQGQDPDNVTHWLQFEYPQ